MTVHKDLGIAFFDPFEYGVTEGDVGDKVAVGEESDRVVWRWKLESG